MTQAKDFLIGHGTDPATLMALLEAAEVPANQDWDNESTTWTFDDGSQIQISGTDVDTHPSDDPKL
jgi:hypothetical protein